MISMKKIKVGIVGCGTIGAELARILVRKFSDRARLVGLSEHHQEKVVKLKKEFGQSIPFVSISQLIRKSDLVIEAASADISAEVAKAALKNGKSVLVMSVGGLLRNPELFLRKNKSRGRLWIPSGAIAGIDGLLAARTGKISEVRLMTTKPPAGLKGAPYFKAHKFPSLKTVSKACVFKGTAYDAVKAFPQNINVAAIISLAGIGAKKTKVEIWTSLKDRLNTHEIFVRGSFGEIRTLTRNIPSQANPKTSALAIQSAVALLEKIFSPVQIGT